MGPADIAFVKAMVLAVFTAGTGLVAYSLRLRYRSRLAESGREGLASRDDEGAQRALFEARVAELEERVDFMERRLAQSGSEARRIEPRVPTPV